MQVNKLLIICTKKEIFFWDSKDTNKNLIIKKNITNFIYLSFSSYHKRRKWVHTLIKKCSFKIWESFKSYKRKRYQKAKVYLMIILPLPLGKKKVMIKILNIKMNNMIVCLETRLNKIISQRCYKMERNLEEKVQRKIWIKEKIVYFN